MGRDAEILVDGAAGRLVVLWSPDGCERVAYGSGAVAEFSRPLAVPPLHRPSDTLAQKGETQRGESGAFLVVLAVAVAASGSLVVGSVVAQCL